MKKTLTKSNRIKVFCKSTAFARGNNQRLKDKSYPVRQPIRMVFKTLPLSFSRKEKGALLEEQAALPFNLLTFVGNRKKHVGWR